MQYLRAFSETTVYFFINFYWNMVSLQRCVRFYHSLSSKVNQLYVHICPLFFGFPSCSSHHRTRSPLCQTAGSHQLLILHIAVDICQSQPPLPSCPFVCSLCLHLYSFLGNRFICTILLGFPGGSQHFSGFHIYVLKYNICFSLSDLLHSV